jgi:chromosome segregation ATPase
MPEWIAHVVTGISAVGLAEVIRGLRRWHMQSKQSDRAAASEERVDQYASLHQEIQDLREDRDSYKKALEQRLRLSDVKNIARDKELAELKDKYTAALVELAGLRAHEANCVKRLAELEARVEELTGDSCGPNSAG